MGQKINLQFEVEQANIIMAALAKLPYENVAELIANIQQQAAPQLQGTPEVEAEEVE